MVEQRPQDRGVDAFDRLHLLGRVAHVSRLVGRLDVDEDEVVTRERRKRGARLGGVVGVEVAGGAGHVYDLDAGVAADALDEVDGGDDRAVEPTQLAEAWAASAPCPGPTARCRSPRRRAAATSGRARSMSSRRVVAAAPPRGSQSAARQSRLSWGGVQTASSLPSRQTRRLRYDTPAWNSNAAARAQLVVEQAHESPPPRSPGRGRR